LPGLPFLTHRWAMSLIRTCALLATTFFTVMAVSAPAETISVPWPNGEKLTYEIRWSALSAADAVFHAIDHGDKWEFQMELKSRGVVETAYPINDWFWSLQEKNPWRSVEYGEDRSEGKKRIKEQTKVDYKAGQAVRERWTQDKVDKFPVTTQALDDIGSMLYTLRCGSWALHDKRTLGVYESSSVKSGEVECVALEDRAIGMWPKQPLLKLHGEPTGSERKKGAVVIWMTNDARRLPLRAYLIFKYGAFTIELIEVGTDK
jgi:hypothetical protein